MVKKNKLLSETAKITLCCAMGFTLLGYDQGLYSGVVVNKYFLEVFNHPNSTVIGHISATYALGCFFGAILTMFIGEKLGRKRTIALGCGLNIIGAILQATCHEVIQMIFGRLIAGIGVGCITSIIPIWQSETCEARLRGKLLVVQLAIVDFGIVIVDWINFGIKDVESSFAWRFPIALQTLWTCLCFGMLIFLPESPRWLISKRKMDKARKVCSMLLNEELDAQEVKDMVAEILIHVEREEEIKAQTGWRDLFRFNEMQNLRRICLGAGAQAMQQLSGINVALYYMPYILTTTGLSDSVILILNACNALNLTLWTFLALFIIDKVGRRMSLFWGFIGQAFCFVMIAVGLAVATHNMQLMAVAFMFLYNTFFALFCNATPWLYPAEVNSQQYRNAGAALATGFDWICNYMVVLITPIAFTNIGWKFYIIFIAFNVIFIPIAYFFYVETALLTLEQVNEKFARMYYEKKGLEYIPPNYADALAEVNGDKSGAMHVEESEVQSV